MLTKNEVVLKAVFDAKRNAVQALQDLSESTANFTLAAWSITNENAQNLMNSTAAQWEAMNAGLHSFWSNTLENLNAALTHAQSTLEVNLDLLIRFNIKIEAIS